MSSRNDERHHGKIRHERHKPRHNPDYKKEGFWSKDSKEKNSKDDRNRTDEYKNDKYKNDKYKNDKYKNDKYKTDRNKNYRNKDDKYKDDKHMNNKDKNDKDKNDKDKNDKDKSETSKKPNFALTGKLAEDTNTFNGVVIKYNQPPEARQPKRKWRLYPFKNDESLAHIPIHRQSAYLLGRDRTVADIPIDHPSCSKQHSVIQFRLVEYDRDDGSVGKRVRPYIIDLDSANGTYLNNKQIEPKKYYELFEKDVLKFGYSTREYVLLHEQSKDDHQDDDVVRT